MSSLNKYKKGTDVKKATLDLLKRFFGEEIEFKISNKIRREIAEIFMEQQAHEVSEEKDLLAAKAEIEKHINRAKTELKNARKLFKNGEIDRDTLFDYEFRLVELRAQLDEINAKLRDV